MPAKSYYKVRFPQLQRPESGAAAALSLRIPRLDNPSLASPNSRPTEASSSSCVPTAKSPPLVATPPPHKLPTLASYGRVQRSLVRTPGQGTEHGATTLLPRETSNALTSETNGSTSIRGVRWRWRRAPVAQSSLVAEKSAYRASR